MPIIHTSRSERRLPTVDRSASWCHVTTTMPSHLVIVLVVRQRPVSGSRCRRSRGGRRFELVILLVDDTDLAVVVIAVRVTVGVQPGVTAARRLAAAAQLLLLLMLVVVVMVMMMMLVGAEAVRRLVQLLLLLLLALQSPVAKTTPVQRRLVSKQASPLRL